MYIESVVKTPEGNFEFKGEINQQEHDLLIAAGLATLCQAGADNFRAMGVDVGQEVAVN